MGKYYPLLTASQLDIDDLISQPGIDMKKNSQLGEDVPGKGKVFPARGRCKNMVCQLARIRTNILPASNENEKYDIKKRF